MPELTDVVPGSPKWLAVRRGGVTATDIVTILGLSSHDSVYSLFWRKLGQVPDPVDTDRWALGRALEPHIVERWDDVNPGVLWQGGLYQSSQRLWQMCTPDQVIINDPPRIEAALECKSWADADRKSWENGPPAAVRAQILWQMDTLDVAYGHWAVMFLPSGRFDHGTIEHDAGCFWPAVNPTSDLSQSCSVCQDIKLMRAAGEEFYRRLTLELPPPDADSSAATLAAVRARFARTEGKQAEVDGTTYAAWSDARDVMDYLKAEVRALEIQLREQAGEAQTLTVDGQPVAQRIVSDSHVKAHTRHMDYYRRVTKKDNEDD